LNKYVKGFNIVLLALLAAFAVVLTFDSILPSESEAATGTVRRAPIQRGAAAQTAPSTFASGNGTQGSPFIIRTVAQLNAFADSVNNGETYAGRHIRLGSNIDLRNVHWASIGFYCALGGTRSFNGSFDGAGFTIFHMGAGNDARRPASSLFGALNGATIDNVCLQFVNITGGANVGGLAGFTMGTTVKNSRVSGAVSGHSAVGGVVGSALGGFMENNHFSGTVTGVSGVGGLIGAVDRVSIRSSKVTGNVDGVTDVGGFVGGMLDGVVISSVVNMVTVNGERNVGGFIGNVVDSGRVERSTFNGQVRGNSNVGGIVGRLTSGSIVSSNVDGSVRGRSQAGGVIGDFLSGEIHRSTTSASVDGMFDIGGLAGRMSGGVMRNSVNSGMINGGEAVGGLVGNFASGDPVCFALESNGSTGHVSGHFSTGPLVGTFPLAVSVPAN